MLVLVAIIAAVVVAAVVVVERYRTAKKSDVDIVSCLRNVDRLNAPSSIRPLDAAPTVELDALTSEAAQRLNAPMAIMTLLDDRRAFVAGSHGLVGEVDIRRETPVHQTYCNYVVTRDEPLRVDDSRRHRLVEDDPANPNRIRSYLGVPVRTRTGHAIGSMCVADTVARHWTDDDIHILEHIADRAMAGTSR